MGSWFYGMTFGDGVMAGSELLDLFREMDPAMPSLYDETVPLAKVDEICDALFAGVGDKPLEYVRGFLSKVLKPTTLETNILTLFGADEILAIQANCAPICEIPKSQGWI